jgi:3-hydroxyacyl-CoA dehydrogenase
MQLTEIRKAAVLGTGQMGPGIVYTLACAGCTVTLFGRTPESAERGLHAGVSTYD